MIAIIQTYARVIISAGLNITCYWNKKFIFFFFFKGYSMLSPFHLLYYYFQINEAKKPNNAWKKIKDVLINNENVYAACDSQMILLLQTKASSRDSTTENTE